MGETHCHSVPCPNTSDQRCVNIDLEDDLQKDAAHADWHNLVEEISFQRPDAMTRGFGKTLLCDRFAQSKHRLVDSTQPRPPGRNGGYGKQSEGRGMQWQSSHSSDARAGLSQRNLVGAEGKATERPLCERPEREHLQRGQRGGGRGEKREGGGGTRKVEMRLMQEEDMYPGKGNEERKAWRATTDTGRGNNRWANKMRQVKVSTC